MNLFVVCENVGCLLVSIGPSGEPVVASCHCHAAPQRSLLDFAFVHAPGVAAAKIVERWQAGLPLLLTFEFFTPFFQLVESVV